MNEAIKTKEGKIGLVLAILVCIVIGGLVVVVLK